jgi:hypothetical protein
MIDISISMTKKIIKEVRTEGLDQGKGIRVMVKMRTTRRRVKS